MVFTILFTVFCVLAFFIAAGFMVSGLSKNNKRVWLTSLVVMVLAIMTPVYMLVSGISTGLNYIASDNMQSDIRTTAKRIGQSAGNTASGVSEGLAESLDEEAFAKLAKKTARIAGKGVQGVVAGLDGTVGKTIIYTTQQADELGITLGRADQLPNGAASAIRIFTEFKKPFSGTLKLESFDSEGLKMDIAQLNIDEKAGTETYLLFDFKQSGPGLSGYCILYAYPE